jgi:microcystin-dependent protein
MSDQFLAEIRLFGFNYAPTGWALCNGQLLPLSQNTALFALLGTTYGGNGVSTFGLPDLQDMVPIHAGEGPGLSLYDLGQSGGGDSVTLIDSEMPFHTHGLSVSQADGIDQIATNSKLATGIGIGQYRATPPNATVPLSPNAVAFTGVGVPHNNLMPYVTLNFCIALQGIFPPRGS